MKLKFIGTDGSLGLQHGKVYDVNLKTCYGLLVAVIKTGFLRETLCPYDSLTAFTKNWELESY